MADLIITFVVVTFLALVVAVIVGAAKRGRQIGKLLDEKSKKDN